MKGVTILNIRNQDTDFGIDFGYIIFICLCIVRRQYLGISKIGFHSGADPGRMHKNLHFRNVSSYLCKFVSLDKSVATKPNAREAFYSQHKSVQIFSRFLLDSLFLLRYSRLFLDCVKCNF